MTYICIMRVKSLANEIETDLTVHEDSVVDSRHRTRCDKEGLGVHMARISMLTTMRTCQTMFFLIQGDISAKEQLEGLRELIEH